MQTEAELKEIYKTPEPNKEICISEEKEKLTISIGNNEFEGEGYLKFQFLPKPQLKIEIKESFSRPLRNFTELYRLSKSHDPYHPVFINFNRKGEAEFIISRFEFNADAEITAEITASPKVRNFRFKSGDQFSEIVFHILNSKSIFSQNALEFEYEAFSIIISKSSIGLIYQKLKNTGGYAITHFGRIRRTDGQTFSKEDADKILDNLFWLLSFANGSWTPIILRVGFDREGNKILEDFESSTPFYYGISDGNHWPSWYDSENVRGMISSLLPEFMEASKNEDWIDAIKLAIYWYILSNTQGANADGAVILIQAALERLSWAYFVQLKKTTASKVFRKYVNAECRISKLLDLGKINSDIPSIFNDLIELKEKLDNESRNPGPQVFVKVRNYLIHPADTSKKPKMHHTMTLGLWYLELVILRLLNYKTGYVNRLNNEAKDMPWVEHTIDR